MPTDNLADLLPAAVNVAKREQTGMQAPVEDDREIAEILAEATRNADEYAQANATRTRAMRRSGENILELMEDLEETRGSFMNRVFDPLIEVFDFENSTKGKISALRIANEKRRLQGLNIEAEREAHATEQAALQARITADRLQDEDRIRALREQGLQLDTRGKARLELLAQNRHLVNLESDDEFEEATAQLPPEIRAELEDQRIQRGHDAFLRQQEYEEAELKRQRVALERMEDGALFDLANSGNQPAQEEVSRRLQIEAMDTRATEEMRIPRLRLATVDELETALNTAKAEGGVGATIGAFSYSVPELQETLNAAQAFQGEAASINARVKAVDQKIANTARNLGTIAGVSFNDEDTTDMMLNGLSRMRGIPTAQQNAFGTASVMRQNIVEQLQAGTMTPQQAEAEYIKIDELIASAQTTLRERALANKHEAAQPAAREYFDTGQIQTAEHARNALAIGLDPQFESGSIAVDAPMLWLYKQYEAGAELVDGATPDVPAEVSALLGSPGRQLPPDEERYQRLQGLLDQKSVIAEMQTVAAGALFQQALEEYTDQYLAENPNTPYRNDILRARREDPQSVFNFLQQDGDDTDVGVRAVNIHTDFMEIYKRLAVNSQPSGPFNVEHAALDRILWSNNASGQLIRMGDSTAARLISAAVDAEQNAVQQTTQQESREQLRGVFSALSATPLLQ